MKIQERDSKGQFSGIRDTEIDAMIVSENEQAQKFIKVCDMIKSEPEIFGIQKTESGNYRLGYKTRSQFGGIALGLAFAINKPSEKIIEILKALCDALGFREKMKAK